MDIGRLLIIVGALLVAGGVLIKLGVPLGRLPGDVVIRGERSSFHSKGCSLGAERRS